MSAFTEAEITYLNSQRLGRLATVDASGAPHVVPVGFRYNPDLDAIDIGGHGIAQSKKYRDAARDGRVALVVDDVLPPWQARGIEILGQASVHPTGGKAIMPDFDDDLLRITPRRIISWGIDTGAFQRHSRAVP